MCTCPPLAATQVADVNDLRDSVFAGWGDKSEAGLEKTINMQDMVNAANPLRDK